MMSGSKNLRRHLTCAGLVVCFSIGLPEHGVANQQGSAGSEARIRLEGGSGSGPRAALERFRKAGSGNKGKKLNRTPKTKRLEGRLIIGGSGEVLLERTVTPEVAAKLERMGFRRVESEKQALHKTILGNKIYVLYQMDGKVYAPKDPERLEGAEVEVEVKHAKDGAPLVTSLKQGRR